MQKLDGLRKSLHNTAFFIKTLSYTLVSQGIVGNPTLFVTIQIVIYHAMNEIYIYINVVNINKMWIFIAWGRRYSKHG